MSECNFKSKQFILWTLELFIHPSTTSTLALGTNTALCNLSCSHTWWSCDMHQYYKDFLMHICIVSTESGLELVFPWFAWPCCWCYLGSRDLGMSESKTTSRNQTFAYTCAHLICSNHAHGYCEFMRCTRYVFITRFIISLIMLCRIGLCCTEMPNVCYLSTFRDFCVAVSPVPRTVFSLLSIVSDDDISVGFRPLHALLIGVRIVRFEI